MGVQTSSIESAIVELERWFSDAGRVVVALSGGVDSAVLAVLGHRVLGEDSLAMTAVSPSLARDELEGVRRLVNQCSLNYREIQTDEIDDPRYIQNGPNRCYVCKSHLFAELEPVARSLNATMVVGTNLDDLGDYRPGLQAAQEFGVGSPYLDCGVNKQMVRSIARAIGLETIAEKPASACLASRIPYGVPVTIQRLSAVERLEQFLHRLGLSSVRVRHHGEIARIEVPVEVGPSIWQHREQIVAEAERLGFLYSTLDLAGFRSGSMNRVFERTTGDEEDRQALV